MEKIRMMTAPVSESFYIAARTLAASRNESLANFVRRAVEKQMEKEREQVKQCAPSQ